MAVLQVPGLDLYDWAEAGTDEGDALVAGGRPGYRQVADTLRARILGNDPERHYPPGTAIPGNGLLAEELDADIAVVNRAVGELARDGLVEVSGRGRKTIVLEQAPWQAAIMVHRADKGMISPAAVEAARAAVTSAAKGDPTFPGEPAVGGPLLRPAIHGREPEPPEILAEMTVLASDMAIAVWRSWALVRESLRPLGGWDLGKPTGSARPA